MFKKGILISIHALREESDDKLFDLKTNIWNISIHALREESDVSYSLRVHCAIEFQSTLSVRRATIRAIQELIEVI